MSTDSGGWIQTMRPWASGRGPIRYRQARSKSLRLGECYYRVRQLGFSTEYRPVVRMYLCWSRESAVVRSNRSRGEWPNPWIWEIFYRGEPLRDRIWGGYFKSEARAVAAGQSKLDELRHRRSEILV
jgi:hypothetical protein